MEHKPSKSFFFALFCLLLLSPFVSSQLDYRYYDATCPNLTRMVRYVVRTAVANDARMAASLLRLHFHDCIVNGCDGSLLLDDTSTFKGEKNALGNKDSVRGYGVIDDIKSLVEKACPSTVSCTDIVALASREAVFLSGGQFWALPLGRRDGTTASDQKGVSAQLPSPFESFENIISKFTSKGLSLKDLAVLSGAHTIGFSQCVMFKRRLFNFDGAGNPDPSLDSTLLTSLKGVCPNQNDSDTTLVAFDPASSARFDNNYYRDLLNNNGLLQSDQALMGDNTTAAWVMSYSKYPYSFVRDFGESMVKLSSLGVLTGKNGEIRKNCRAVN